MNLTTLTTEQRNENSMTIDQMPTIDILKTINNEDKLVARAVELAIPKIEVATEKIYKALAIGGRLFYIGAGTSGRVGVIDASECPPTFMSDPELVQTIMAGGNEAFTKAIEESEDNELQGEIDLQEKQLTDRDVVIGITASGRTPYPIGALKYASKIGAYTISLSSNEASLISQYADCAIEVVVGPEVLTGSTRMKAATSHKMVLNMISTTTMIKLGKVYENLMVDLYASNYKLLERAKHILMEIVNVTYEDAENALKITNNKVKPAIVMLKGNVTFEEAQEAIQKTNGYVRQAINYVIESQN